MEPAIVFTAVAAIAVTVYLISSIMIYADLKKRNIKVSFIFLRFMIPLYANEYKKITCRNRKDWIFILLLDYFN